MKNDKTCLDILNIHFWSFIILVNNVKTSIFRVQENKSYSLTETVKTRSKLKFYQKCFKHILLTYSYLNLKKSFCQPIITYHGTVVKNK